MDAAIRELQGAIKDMARRVEELEKWAETFRNCIEMGNQMSTTHEERHEVLNERIGTLSARMNLLQPRQKDMVPCPECQDGLVFTPGDADDPASHDRCQLCEGTAEVREGVAAYVGRLQRSAERSDHELRYWESSSRDWRGQYRQGVADRNEKDSQAALALVAGESGPGAGMGESMGREG